MVVQYLWEYDKIEDNYQVKHEAKLTSHEKHILLSYFDKIHGQVYILIPSDMSITKYVQEFKELKI